MSAGAEAPGLERRTLNPWTWQDAIGFSQGCEVVGPSRTVTAGR